jgi:hypothetical protein
MKRIRWIIRVQLVDFICSLHPEAQLSSIIYPVKKDDVYVYNNLKEASRNQVFFDLYVSSLRNF